MATIPGVSDNELIRTTWGDAVADELNTNVVKRAGSTMTGALTVGVDPFGGSGAGVGLGTSGSIGVLRSATGINLNLLKAAPGFAVGEHYVGFFGHTAATATGAITLASSSSVAYQTTSDPRLKQRTGDVDDAADIVHGLGAKAYRGLWIADEGGGQEWVFLNSTDVEVVAPYAVNGAAGAIDGDGNPIYQQVDYSSLVPLLFSALSQALDRIEALEAAA